MAKWAADFSLATEITQTVLNLVLDRFLDFLRSKSHHTYTVNTGFFGSLTATLNRIAITDIDDKPPRGGVITDLEANGDILFRLLWFIPMRTGITLQVDDVELDFTTTPACMPKGIVMRILPSFDFRIRFHGGIFGTILNLLAPIVQLGAWLILGLIRKVEIPVWELVDIFAVLGIRFAPGSPLLTAQKQVLPASLMLASDFNLTDPLRGNPDQLGHFLPQATNIGAVLHERVVAAALHIAIVKGWVPTRFKVAKFKIYITAIQIEFEKDMVVAFGRLRAKRKKCWTRVKVAIKFRIEVKPVVTDVATPDPKVVFSYNADINAHISTSGMLVVLGVVMYAPLFLSLTISLSFLVNIVLKQFMPFTVTWQQSGLSLSIRAKGSVQGFVPLSMTFPLQLTGSGHFSLARFRQFTLPGGSNVNVGYTNESLSIQEDELRVAANLS